MYSDHELDAILSISRRNNALQEITGILLYHEGAILQVLEGPKGSVQEAYARIATDPRHKNVTLVLEQESSARHFPDWAMGFRRMNNAQWQRADGYLPVDRNLMRYLEPSGSAALMTFIHSFYNANFLRLR